MPKTIMRKIVTTENFKVNGLPINNIRYADDTVLLANNTQDLQQLLSSLQNESKKRGLTINKKKTKIMVLSKTSDIPSSDIFLDGEKLEQTNQFDYLGSLVTSDCRCDKEIRRRIVLAKKAFIEKKNILADKKLNIKLRTRLLKCYVWSVLLYGCESWTISSSCRKKLEAAEMWCYRRMMRMSWVKRVSNEQILEMVGTESDDHQKKTAKVCWTCGEKRRAGKVGARRKDQREKTKRKKEIELHGGTGIGCWLQCSDCFAADR